MTKKELEARIEQLERELRLVTQQLNNHICDRAAPVYITPVAPYTPATPWPGNTWTARVDA